MVQGSPRRLPVSRHVMPISDLVRPVRLRCLGGAEARRKVTWLELFFDLVFAAAVSQVGAPLSADYSVDGLLRFSALFLLIWWAWIGHTTFSTRFDTDDLVQRLLTLGQMFAVAVMAINAKDALDSRASAGFAAAYAAMRFVLVAQYLRARQVQESRALTTHFFAGHGTAAALWLISALVPTPLRFWIWIVALVIDFGTPLAGASHTAKIPPDAAHLPERVGLFTIILLGESMIAVMQGMESQETWSTSAAISALLGMCLIFSVWWWYFDGIGGAAERHVRTRRQATLFQVWSYAHLPLYLGIVTVGVGLEHIITRATTAPLHAPQAWIMCGALALLMGSMTVLAATSESARESVRPRSRVLAGIMILATIGLAALGPIVSPAVLLAVLSGILVAQMTLALGEQRAACAVPASSDKSQLMATR